MSDKTFKWSLTALSILAVFWMVLLGDYWDKKGLRPFRKNPLSLLFIRGR